MGNTRNRRSRRGQSPSLERELSTSEIETSQGNETFIETLGNFETVSSIRNEEIALDSGTQIKMKCKFGPKDYQIKRTKKWQT